MAVCCSYAPCRTHCIASGRVMGAARTWSDSVWDASAETHDARARPTRAAAAAERVVLAPVLVLRAVCAAVLTIACWTIRKHSDRFCTCRTQLIHCSDALQRPLRLNRSERVIE